MTRQVPTLDVRRFDDEATRDTFVAELGRAYREYGFCGITGHDIPEVLIEDAYTAFQQFFALPEAVKMGYQQAGSGGARGYTPFKVETAKGAVHPDLKEFFHIGREIPRDSKFAAVMAPNVWPDEVPSFKPHGYALFDALDRLGRRLLSALALHIDLPADFFDDKIDCGNSILRPIHYPPIASGAIPNVRAGAHEDINLITFLVGASAAGLELQMPDGRWLPITTQGDTIVVNIGDMLQRLTNHVYPSTTHRVINPPGDAARRARYSVPYFLHPNPDVSLAVLPSCVSSDHPSRYPDDITANDYLLQRLREIKLL